MKVVQSAAAFQRLALRWKRTGTPTALVPTMGCLHSGHTSLVARARKLVGPKGIVSLSIYVNPTQFAPTEDLAAYPRDLAADKAKCRIAGVDYIFAPADREMYPAGEVPYSTYISEDCLSRAMEGASRPTHFRGVTTVVGKLFNLALPDFAVFGAKDFQQATVIQKMVHDLNFPVKIVVAETVREPDGLAMSSRNKYLSSDERRQATILIRSIGHARRRVQKSRVTAATLKAEIADLVRAEPAARIDYAEFFSSTTLQPVALVRKGAHMALAVFIGKTRLIDNAVL